METTTLPDCIVNDFAEQEYMASLYAELYGQTLDCIYTIEKINSSKLDAKNKRKSISDLIQKLYFDNDFETQRITDIRDNYLTKK